MKKTSLILAILIAFALVVTGCPGEGDSGDDGKKSDSETPGGETTDESWVAKDDTGEKLGNGKTKQIVKQEEDNYVHIFFNPTGKNFDKIKINFTYGEPGVGFNMSWQCAYDANGTWGQGGDDYIGWQEEGPIEIDPSVMFKSGWGTIANGATRLDKASMKGICLRVNNTDGSAATFTLVDVVFVGLE